MEFITSKVEHMLMILSQTTPTYVTFNKGEYVGHLEPPIEDMQQLQKIQDH